MSFLVSRLILQFRKYETKFNRKSCSIPVNNSGQPPLRSRLHSSHGETSYLPLLYKNGSLKKSILVCQRISRPRQKTNQHDRRPLQKIQYHAYSSQLFSLVFAGLLRFAARIVWKKHPAHLSVHLREGWWAQAIIFCRALLFVAHRRLNRKDVDPREVQWIRFQPLLEFYQKHMQRLCKLHLQFLHNPPKWCSSKIWCWNFGAGQQYYADITLSFYTFSTSYHLNIHCRDKHALAQPSASITLFFRNRSLPKR